MKKLLSLTLAILLILGLGTSAFAMVQGDIDQEIQKPGLDAALERAWKVIKADECKSYEELSEENNANLYHYNPYGHTEPIEPVISAEKQDSWDDIIEKLFEKYGIEEGQENLALSYYNTVTGETHYYNEDKYFVTASLFKVPLCMLVAEQVADGKITMDEQIYNSSFEYLEFRALAHSDNEAALMLENYLGGYLKFRDLQVKYMGSDPKDDIGDATYYESYNTAKQITNCLKILQADPEQYPGVIENMLIDTPYEYFKMWDRRYPTAQKWGYVPHTDEYGAHDYVNNGGIIYTDQPIILLVLTDNLSLGYDVIGEYATLMIDYTNFRTAEFEQQKEVADREIINEVSKKQITDYVEPLALVEKTVGETTTENQTKNNEVSEMSVRSSVILLLILSAVVFALVFIFRRNSAGRIKTIWAVIGILIAGGALILCVMALNTGTITATVEGEPKDSVQSFFDNLIMGQYDAAYENLYDYSSLGLENEPKTAEGKLIYNALKQSWSYSINEPAVVDKLNATQKVTLRYLDIASLEQEAASRVEDSLKTVVQSKPIDEVYDSNNKYKPEITDEVYMACLEKAVEHASSHYKTVELNLSLVYENGKWMIKTSNELLTYLLGGIS